MQDYKFLSAAVMLFATLVNTQTHRHIHSSHEAKNLPYVEGPL